jgi:hypothetical protein
MTMKFKFILVPLLVIAATTLQAQEDTTYVEEAVEYEDGEGYSEEDEEPHTLVNPDQLNSTKEYQSEKVYHKAFDEKKWRDIVGDNNYREDIEEEEEEENESSSQMRMPSMPWGGEALKAIGYGLIIAIVLFLLYYIVRNIKVNPKAKFVITPFNNDQHDDIQEMDLAALLRQALDSKNYRLAVRFYFLTLLKSLHDAGKIRWEKDKTNREYLSELFNREFHYDEVRLLTRGYEEVWYGEHSVPDEALLSLIAGFETINAKINPPGT